MCVRVHVCTCIRASAHVRIQTHIQVLMAPGAGGAAAGGAHLGEADAAALAHLLDGLLPTLVRLISLTGGEPGVPGVDWLRDGRGAAGRARGARRVGEGGVVVEVAAGDGGAMIMRVSASPACVSLGVVVCASSGIMRVNAGAQTRTHSHMCPDACVLDCQTHARSDDGGRRGRCGPASVRGCERGWCAGRRAWGRWRRIQDNRGEIFCRRVVAGGGGSGEGWALAMCAARSCARSAAVSG